MNESATSTATLIQERGFLARVPSQGQALSRPVNWHRVRAQYIFDGLIVWKSPNSPADSPSRTRDPQPQTIPTPLRGGGCGCGQERNTQPTLGAESKSGSQAPRPIMCPSQGKESQAGVNIELGEPLPTLGSWLLLPLLFL